jgi:hypothetical protein
MKNRPRLAAKQIINVGWRWSPKEDAYIKEMAVKESAEQIASYLRRTISATGKRAAFLGVKFSALRRRWTKQEDDYIREHALEKTARQMSQNLGRTTSAVKSRSEELKVSLQNPPVAFSCGWCKKKTKRNNANYNERREHHFCGRRCHDLFRRHRPCPICEGVDTQRGEGRTCRACRHMYRTVHSHWSYIFNPYKSRHDNYSGMAFCAAWDPNKGGSFLNGAKWIFKNIGRRPEPGYSLDIIKHEIGFVPGNLRWASKRTQKDNQQHRALGKMSETEFAAEARRRGWKRGLVAV